ncbi:tyrosine--tRNA ligase 1, cytoplasmic-like protein isoform X1, partial [Tanacetum coccineum]
TCFLVCCKDKKRCQSPILLLLSLWKMRTEEVERKEEHGGEKVFSGYEELVADYAKGDFHPADLKPALSKALNEILQPLRDHFENDENAKALLKKVKG